MKEWWAGLQSNERRVLILGAVALAVIIPVFGIWLPLQDNVADLRQQVEEQRALQRWMNQAAVEVKQLQGGSNRQAARPTDGRSLLALVDQTAKRGSLGAGLKRLEPEGQTSVKVWLEQVSFDDMVSWLHGLEQQYGLVIATITIDRKDLPGRVDARMTLEAGAS